MPLLPDRFSESLAFEGYSKTKAELCHHRLLFVGGANWGGTFAYVAIKIALRIE